MPRCDRCLINVPLLDSGNVCSYCRVMEKYSDIVSQIGKREDALGERIDLFRGRAKYDCLVGLSGGKDSSFIVYRLISHYKANVLTFTCDNGFMTDVARQNINRIVDEFNVDHVWVNPSESVKRELYAANLKSEGWPCSACVHMLDSAAWKLAYDNQIPFIVSGKTPEQMLRHPDDYYMSLIEDNLAPYDSAKVGVHALKVLKRIEQEKEWLLSDKGLWPLAEKELYPPGGDNSKDIIPEYLYFFLFEGHNELKLMDILEKETSWVGPSDRQIFSHNDCVAHDAAGFLYYRMWKSPFVALETCSLVRLNQISRHEGEIINQKARRDVLAYPKNSMEALSRLSGVPLVYLGMLPHWIMIRRFLKTTLRGVVDRSKHQKSS